MARKIVLSGVLFIPLLAFFSWYIVNIANPYNLPPYSTYVLFTIVFATACIIISLVCKKILSDSKMVRTNNVILLSAFFAFYFSTLLISHFLKPATVETNFYPGYVISYFLSPKFLNELGIIPFFRYLFYFGIRFIPIAFMFPLMFRTMRKPIVFSLSLLCISFGFELIQSITHTGSSYFDDALVGFCVGMIFYVLSLLLIKKSSRYQSFLCDNFLWQRGKQPTVCSP